MRSFLVHKAVNSLHVIARVRAAEHSRPAVGSTDPRDLPDEPVCVACLCVRVCGFAWCVVVVVVIGGGGGNFVWNLCGGGSGGGGGGGVLLLSSSSSL